MTTSRPRRVSPITQAWSPTGSLVRTKKTRTANTGLTRVGAQHDHVRPRHVVRVVELGLAQALAVREVEAAGSGRRRGNSGSGTGVRGGRERGMVEALAAREVEAALAWEAGTGSRVRSGTGGKERRAQGSLAVGEAEAAQGVKGGRQRGASQRAVMGGGAAPTAKQRIQGAAGTGTATPPGRCCRLTASRRPESPCARPSAQSLQAANRDGGETTARMSPGRGQSAPRPSHRTRRQPQACARGAGRDAAATACCS